MKRTIAPTLLAIPSRSFWIWIVLLGLGVLLIAGLILVPSSGEINPTFHVASRYIDRGPGEAAFTSPFLSVLLDYRSFDLMILSSFFLTVTLATLLFCTVENITIRPGIWRGPLLVGFFSWSLWGLGWIGLKEGSNFMDYEVWAVFFGPEARTAGAAITGVLALMTLIISLLWTWKILVSGKKGPSWR